MKDKYKMIVAPSTTSVVCDTPNCDFTIEGVKKEDLIYFIDTNCMKCNANMLTESDYRAHQTMLKIVKFINILACPFIATASLLVGEPDERTTISYHHHAGKVTIKKEDEETKPT